MKKTLLLFACAAVVPFLAAAQNYSFSHSGNTYTPLTGATQVSNGQVWNNNDFILDIGFPFMFAGESFTEAEIDSDGGIGFDGATKPEIMVFGADLEDKGTGTSLSPISTLLTGTPGNRVRIIEWNNAGFFTGDDNDFVNFQVLLFESNGRIEIRFGPSSIANLADAFDGETGPPIGLVFDGSLSGGAYTGLVLSGLATAPQAQTVTATSTDYFLNGMPADGQMYIFTNSTSAASSVLSTATGFTLYPNPASELVTIEFATPTSNQTQVSVFNSLGQLVFKQEASKKQALQLKTSEFPAGIYLVEVEHNRQRYIKRLVIQ